MTGYRIERGAESHVARLREIERAAGARFRTIGMDDIAEGDPTPADILEDRAQGGRLYVALGEAATVAGFLIWSPKDGRAYIEEVSVHPEHAGHRLASRLIDRLRDDVRDRFAALTLATFRDVPWNAPFYARHGFRTLEPAELTPGLVRLRQIEQSRGLRTDQRVIMRHETD